MNLDTTSILAMSALVLSVANTVLHAINHKRIRSECCGRKADISFDLENTTPKLPAQESFVEKKQSQEESK